MANDNLFEFKVEDRVSVTENSVFCPVGKTGSVLHIVGYIGVGVKLFKPQELELISRKQKCHGS